MSEATKNHIAWLADIYIGLFGASLIAYARMWEPSFWRELAAEWRGIRRKKGKHAGRRKAIRASREQHGADEAEDFIAALTPATDAAPWQAPIPGVASPAPGTTLAPAPWPAPEAVVREPVTRDDAAVLTPPPAAPPSTGAGQHESDATAERRHWVILPDQQAVEYLGKHVRIQPLANPGKCETTGAQPAFVRPARRMYEEWLDTPARTA